jgi:hypothetical protein
MKKSFENYTYLAGRTGGKGSLWQGDDHLLVVEGRGWLLPFTEVYRRVDYDKIQVITLVPSKTHVWASVGFGVSAVIFGLLAFLSRNEEPFLPVSLAVPAVLLTVLLVVNIARGSSCRCSIQTAVQILRLRPLVRVRSAEPVMKLLEDLCRRQQANLVPPPMRAPVAAEAAPALSLPPGLPETLPGGKPPWPGSNWTFATGLLMLLWGPVLAAELFVPGLLLTSGNVLLGAAVLVMGIVALVHTLRYRAPLALLTCLWVNLAVDLLAGLAMYIVAVAGVMHQGLEKPDAVLGRSSLENERIFTALADYSIDQCEPWGWGLVLLGSLLLLLGLSIVVYGGKARRAPAARATETPPPPPPVVPAV